MCKIRFLFLLRVFSAALYSGPADAVQGYSTTTNTAVSDGSTQQGQRFVLMEKASELRFLTGKTKVGADTLLTQGNNLQDLFSAVRAVLKWEHTFSDESNFDGGFGPHYLTNQTTKEAHVAAIGYLRYFRKVPRLLDWSIVLSHDYAYIDGFHPGAIKRYSRITTLNPWFNFHLGERLRTQLSSNIKIINDGNVKTDPELVTTYALIKNKNTLWLGAGAQQIAFSQQTPDYWSPTRIVNFGPRLELDWHFTQFLKSNLRFSGNRSYDEGPKAWGHSYYSYLDLQYFRIHHWKIALAYERIETQVNHSIWFMNQLSLNAEALF